MSMRITVAFCGVYGEDDTPRSNTIDGKRYRKQYKNDTVFPPLSCRTTIVLDWKISIFKSKRKKKKKPYASARNLNAFLRHNRPAIDSASYSGRPYQLGARIGGLPLIFSTLLALPQVYSFVVLELKNLFWMWKVTKQPYKKQADALRKLGYTAYGIQNAVPLGLSSYWFVGSTVKLRGEQFYLEWNRIESMFHFHLSFSMVENHRQSLSWRDFG